MQKLSLLLLALLAGGCTSNVDPETITGTSLQLTVNDQKLKLAVHKAPVGTRVNRTLNAPNGVSTTIVQPQLILPKLSIVETISKPLSTVSTFTIKGAGEFDRFLVNVTTKDCRTSKYINLAFPEFSLCGYTVNVVHK
ncbi:hypothetical protein L1D14_07715 [Vibrio tubiashii]|uniref:hypothetical protein n=1 Tax=Vibrio tubiashii TaxID=29498 RepID=UPI001EFE8204|nr:hypothetical protein [Vibrio tubiashii]MCG9576126.1 hypothetical protein [Vibrio tubiashii]